jgi:hypothetical protein
MCLAPPGDLHGLCEAAHVTNVEAGKLGMSTLDIGKELPLGGELFANCKGDICHLPQGFVRFRCLIADRLLQEV